MNFMTNDSNSLTFGIIEVDCLQIVSTDHFLKLSFHLLISFLRPDVIACNYNTFAVKLLNKLTIIKVDQLLPLHTTCSQFIRIIL